MGTIPVDKVAGDELTAVEANLLRDGSLVVDLNAGETINGATLPVACYIDATENEWIACDANDQTKLNFLGFAISNSTDGNSIQVRKTGVVGGFTGLTTGDPCYVQDDKTIAHTLGTYEVLVGYAISATQILIQKGSWEYMGSAAISATNVENSGTPYTSISDDITMPTNARFAIINMSVTTLNNGVSTAFTGANLTLCRVGIVAPAAKNYVSSSGFTNSATLSVNTITVYSGGYNTSDNNHGYTLSGTVYFYR